MKNKKSVVILIISILILIGVVYGIYLVFSSYYNSPARPSEEKQTRKDNISTTTSNEEKSCQGMLCQKSPCGPLPNGGNSCDNVETVCYEKICQNDADCLTNQRCINIDCFSGDAIEDVRACVADPSRENAL